MSEKAMPQKVVELKCKETENCKGMQKLFCYMETPTGTKVSQYKCDECGEYIRIVDGRTYSMGKYNGLTLKKEAEIREEKQI